MIEPAHVLLAVLEFFLINWLGKHSISSGYYQITFVQDYEDAPLFNLVFRVLAPTVFLVLVTTGLYLAGADAWVVNIWLVTVYYFAVRWGYNLLMGRGKLLVWPNQIAIAAIATLTSRVVYTEFLTDRAAVVPSARALVDELWIIVILFLYQTFRNVSPFGSRHALATRRSQYLLGRYKDARRKYHQHIASASQSREVELLAYSVLLYESFNRPFVHRLIERYLLFPLGYAKSLGPMQVRTAESLPDGLLVEAGVRKLQRDFEDSVREEIAEDPRTASMLARRSNDDGIELPFEPTDDWSHLRADEIGYWSRRSALDRTLRKYNIRSDYPSQVMGIFDELQSTFYPDLGP